MPDAPVLLAGRYRLGESLGRGGMGQVLLARDETLERDVAIKELDQPIGNDGGASARRTLREARAAARINHPNVVQVYDVLQLDDRTWIVMEYVPCRSLREEITEQGPLDPYRVARIGLDLLGALRTAHRLGVEHRDVKPANVLLAEDGRVLLTDFGIAAVDDDAVISRSDILVGSPQYMAPERAQFGTSGPEADLWSLGATLYSAIEGRAPYERGSTMATLTALTTEEPDPPKRAGVLRPLLDGLLRKDPVTRMTAEDAESLARGILGGLSEPGETEPGSKTGGGLAGLASMLRIPRSRSGGSTAGADGSVPDDGSGGGAVPDADAGPETVRDDDGDAGAVGDEGPGALPREDPGSLHGGGAGVAQGEAGGAQGEDAGGRSRDGAGAAAAGMPGDDRVLGAGRAPVRAVTARERRPSRGILMGAVVLALMLAAGTAWAVNSGSGEPDAAAPTVTESSGAPDTGVSPGAAGDPQGSVGPDAAQAPQTGGASAPAAAESPAPSASAAGGRPPMPAGWKLHKDSTGFSVYVPKGWERSKKKGSTMVYFRGDNKILGIDQTDKPKSNPVKDWRGQADYRVSEGDFPGYKEIKIDPVDYFQKAADWEFTFNRDGARRHTINRGTVISSKKAYGFYWETNESVWADSRDELQLVFDSFQPAK
ncbi:MAG TPA: protein kinase [Actinoplanes sp.]|nr:protein kinase [Actinoplanes sp.]